MADNERRYYFMDQGTRGDFTGYVEVRYRPDGSIEIERALFTIPLREAHSERVRK